MLYVIFVRGPFMVGLRFQNLQILKDLFAVFPVNPVMVKNIVEE